MNLLNYIYDYSKRSLLLQVAFSLLVLHIILVLFLLAVVIIGLYSKVVFFGAVISILTFLVWNVMYGLKSTNTTRE
jgi:hypothetical protein